NEPVVTDYTPAATHVSFFDFFCEVFFYDNQTEMRCTYNAEKYDPETVDALLADYLAILRRTLLNPDVPVRDLL
ncbi:MAG: hypothetical protein ICV83_21070, partial [Cytophagales bacterium]|nr:hypothetical protein [Cytophagales bacterium]